MTGHKPQTGISAFARCSFVQLFQVGDCAEMSCRIREQTKILLSVPCTLPKRTEQSRGHCQPGGAATPPY
jgi:hypothetical protein